MFRECVVCPWVRITCVTRMPEYCLHRGAFSDPTCDVRTYGVHQNVDISVARHRLSLLKARVVRCLQVNESLHTDNRRLCDSEKLATIDTLSVCARGRTERPASGANTDTVCTRGGPSIRSRLDGVDEALVRGRAEHVALSLACVERERVGGWQAVWVAHPGAARGYFSSAAPARRGC